MSIQAINAALDVHDIGPTRKWLLIVLANYANTDCQCWPSQETLAEDTELSERTIITALKELEVGGLIQREQRRDKGGHRLSDLITLLFLPARDAGRQKGLGAKSVGLAATDSEPNLQMTAGLPATVAGTYKDEPPMNHQEEPQLERASHTDVCAARIFMAAHPAHRARCGDDPGVIERELKSLAADGHNIEAITETLVAYYSHPKQQEHDGRFAKRFLNAFLERKWATWRPEGARPMALKEVGPDVAVGPDQSIAYDGHTYKIPMGRTAGLIGTPKDPGIRRQIDWMTDWRENPARWTVHEQGPRPGEPGWRIWPSVLERFGLEAVGD